MLVSSVVLVPGIYAQDLAAVRLGPKLLFPPLNLQVPFQISSTTQTSRLFYGTVWSANLNQPIQGATVSASSSGYSVSTATGSDGTWNMVLPWGSYTITVSASGYQSQSFTIDWQPGTIYSGGSVNLQPSATTTASSTSQSSRPFFGSVWNPSLNQPIAGATVTASSSGYSQASVTGSNGMWNMILPWGSYTITVSASGYQSQSFQIDWEPGQAFSGGVVNLQPLTTAVSSSTESSASTTQGFRQFYGWVFGGTPGQPLAGVTVTALRSGYVQSVVTASDGSFSMVLPYGTYTITFHAPGYISQSFQISWNADTVFSGGGMTLQPLTTASTTTVTASVTVTEGTIVQGLVMQVVSNSTVSGLVFDSVRGLLNFTVSGPPGTSGFLSVKIAKGLLSGTPVLLIDGVQQQAVVTEDSNFWYINAAYTHSSHQITIGGSNAVPEFKEASQFLMAVAILISLALVSLRKRAQPRL